MPTPDIFLSYSREDQQQARRIAAAFELEGFNVWWDQALAAGEAFDQVTEKALDDSRAVVVLWSPRSVTSRWVRAEAAQADEAGKLVPVQIEPCTVPVKFKLTQTADLTGWSGDTSDPRWRTLVGGLQRHAGLQERAALPSSMPEEALRAPDAGRPRRTPLLVAGLVAVLVIGGGAAWFLGRHQQAGSATEAQQLAPTVAVLPFADLSPAKDQESFSDGMTEEILNSLARISGMQVTGRTSSFYFKGRNEPLQSIGQQLGVNYLLEGSVRKQGDELRVTAQLIKAADGFHLWSQTYDRSTQDIFSIQEDIARSVADALQVALGVGELGAAPGMTRDVTAYEMYLEGLPEARRLTLDGYQAAARKFEAAVQRDPRFLLAWGATWNAYMNAWSMSGNNPSVRDAMLERAEALRAQIASNFPDDPIAREFIYRTDEEMRGDWIPGAQDAIKRSTQPPTGLEPPGFDIVVAASVGRVRLDKASEALSQLERLRDRDPLNSNVMIYLPEAYANVGRLADAQAEIERGWKLAPSELIAANGLIIALGAQDAEGIRVGWERSLSVTQPGSLIHIIHALRDKPAEIRAELRRQAQLARSPASQLALFAAAFGDPELALKILREDKDVTRRVISVMALWRPVARDMRQLPQFKDLVREWKLVDYWREHGWGDHCKPVGVDDFECR